MLNDNYIFETCYLATQGRWDTDSSLFTWTRNVYFSVLSRLKKNYLSKVPPTRRAWHKGFFKVGPSTGPKPKHARWLQKCLNPYSHSLKKGRLRCQVIKLAPPRRVRAREDGLLRLVDASLGTPDMNASFSEFMSDSLD